MRSGSFAMLVLSLLVAAGAAFFGNQWLERRLSPNNAPGVATAPVVVAVQDLQAGATIAADALQVVQTPLDSIPEGHFASAKELVGAIARQPVYKGEVLLKARVLSEGGDSVLAALITKGNRAVTLPVNDVTGVAGFLLPGTWVDVIVTVRDGAARTLLERIKVLAVDQTISASGKDAVPSRAVTLEVTPAQAEQLAAAQGAIRLTLRNPEDFGASAAVAPVIAEPPVAAEPPDAAAVASAAPPAPRRELVVVEVIRGTALNAETFESKDQ